MRFRLFSRRGSGGRRSGLAPVVDAIEGVQDMYLGRPGSPVAYGEEAPDPDATLVVDAPEPDPADLRGSPTPSDSPAS